MYYQKDEVKEGAMGMECSMLGRGAYTGFWLENLKERAH
jgi:hypothetical protein